MQQREKREFVFDCVVVLCTWLLGLALGYALSSCATIRPEPVAPLLATTPLVATDSLVAPEVNFRRPDYARSLPTRRGDVIDAAPVASTRGSVLGALYAVFGGKVKDKSRNTYQTTIYNAPAKVKDSNVATDSGTVTDNRKAAKKQDEKPKIDQSTNQGLASGHIVAGVVVVLVIAALGFFFFRRK
ncbi:hypothetical protein [Hymenobacter defluvii]|uniref:Uncharacterized protein n=1 Tax=Hymenobacter defluvii TaxID=2054411 RepID=A0ABS3TDP2_9BACT|nr:hypothetical protein [Hymenobacter defluvii]MBO3270749.1 hypothetical protein [Hymenobacter defluvii]